MTGRGGRWWRDAVGYEVYLRSFADGDGDGIGDLRGLAERLDYLAWLGVGIVWVTPFYPSPMRDHGYDVADYCSVDPSFGTLADFDAVVARAHALGLRVVIDLVANHTSSDHPWFVQARSSTDNPYRDYYIWRDPAPGGHPPNNWVSHFGGPAWSLDDATGQYWLHLFLPEQPDLNWANPAVLDEFDEILRFWLDRDVDGFRVDVAHGLVKHPQLPDNPRVTHPPAALAATGAPDWRKFEHRYDMHQPEVLDIYRRWRTVVDPYGALLLGEAYVLDPERLANYVRDQQGLHLAFWFKPLHIGWEPAAVRDVLRAACAAAPAGLAWVQSSHDRPRPVTRFGGGALGQRRALLLALLTAGLPETPFVYQGEELGLEDAPVGPGEAQDPMAVRGGNEFTRDAVRSPMPWRAVPGLGFTTAPRAWLPFGTHPPEDTVEVQRAEATSPLHRYRSLFRIRCEEASLRRGALEWVDHELPIVGYRRGATVVVANCGERTTVAPLPAPGTVLFSTTGEGEGARVQGGLELGAYEGVIVRVQAGA